MADDQVKYSDLFDAGIIGEVQKLTNEITSLKDAIAAAKTEANGLRDNLRGAGTATREQQQQTAADAAAMEALNKQVKDLTDKLAKLEERKKRYSKLTNEETASVEALRQALAGEAQEQIDATKAIDIQSKSYNELYQTYNALKDALNKMTVAERANTAAGKAMVNRAKEIRDTLNNLQQQTGNYTLNVGNYMSALNGLQFQTQQVLREIPSAQNLSQFFLAISNNIPMLIDTLTRYNKGLPEIKAKLAAVTEEISRQKAAMAGMNAESAEYAAKQVQINQLQRQQVQLQGLSISGFKAMIKSVGTWQTLLLVVLMLLRKLPDEIKKISKEWRILYGQLTDQERGILRLGTARAQTERDIIESYTSQRVEMELLVSQLKTMTKGTEDYKTVVDNINELAGERIVSYDMEIDRVALIADQWLENARAVAQYNAAVKIVSGNEENKKKSEMAFDVLKNGGTFAQLAAIMGWTGQDYEDMEKLFRGSQGDFGWLERFFVQGWGKGKDPVGKYLTAQNKKGYLKKLEQAIFEATPYMSDEDLDKYIKDMFKPQNVKRNGNVSGKKAKEQTEESLDDRYWDAERALLEAEQEGYELERSLAKLERDKQMSDLAKWYEEQRTALQKNLSNHFLTQEQYDERIKELNRQTLALRLGIRKEYEDAVNKSIEEEIENGRKAAEEREKEAAKARYKAINQSWQEERARLVERGAKRKELLNKEIEAEIARLNTMLKLERSVNGEKMTPEEKAKIEEWIRLLEKMKKAGDFGDMKPGSIFGNGGSRLSNEKKNYTSVWEVLQIDIDKNQISALNSVFDQAKEALNSWMDARKAAADQAKELADDEVSAAENALNREIELRNQGYANDVALREKELADAKAAQKKAAEEQKKVAQEQVLLDAALQTSSMITASANIIKQFPNPLAWAPMLALMWGTFAYAKTKAYQASTKSIKFKEGGVMLLEGGSHESGHDVNLGIGPDGSNLRAEGGEYFAVINKRSSRKYGSQIPAVVNALNSGMFEDRYIKTSDAVGLLPQVIRADNGSYVDLSKVEGGVDALVKQGEQNWTIEGGYRVLRYKNLTRRVKIG